MDRMCRNVANNNSPGVKDGGGVNDNVEEQIMPLKLKYQSWNQYLNLNYLNVI